MLELCKKPCVPQPSRRKKALKTQNAAALNRRVGEKLKRKTPHKEHRTLFNFLVEAAAKDYVKRVEFDE